MSNINYTDRFCLCVNLALITDQAAIEAILSFFFFQNYDKPLGIPQLLVQYEENAIYNDFIELFSKSAALQGFNQINVVCVNPDKSVCALLSADKLLDIRTVYQRCLDQLPLKVDINLYISVFGLKDIIELNIALEEEESLYKQQNLNGYRLAEEYKKLVDCVNQLELINKAAKQEIDNQYTFNQILKSGSHAVYLQNYYDNEYEILPLWYKQLGHIIKVLTGKRSLRSLFDNNITKYEN
ncbi:hypothetical protein [Pontibacter liquoris]|uniref:hypothetical protein n=1 Tax=Pontibacter liquoris TaxID=2905677 RepID=UPI001FA6FDAD|nr:hypothetical protein [Pontibacter liquoris]